MQKRLAIVQASGAVARSGLKTNLGIRQQHIWEKSMSNLAQVIGSVLEAALPALNQKLSPGSVTLNGHMLICCVVTFAVLVICFDRNRVPEVQSRWKDVRFAFLAAAACVLILLCGLTIASSLSTVVWMPYAVTGSWWLLIWLGTR